jgi:glycosyltransferase involved in cell wall biosynthesis
MNLSISIVTACYNSSRFLDRVYNSLLRQTYRQFEWICVDDGSKDDTIERLLDLAPPGEQGMRVYRLPQNTGGPVALAFGTEVARGAATIWLDHDDELFPNALETVRAHWEMVDIEAGEAGLFLRASDPVSGRMIGRELETGRRLSWSQMSNRYPEISDGTFAFRTDLLRRFASIERMEALNLNGIMFNEMSARHPFIVVDVPIRYYHRDNVESQTRLERVSRKSVSTYARLFDGADRYFLLSPLRWTRHVLTMFRYSTLVFGDHRQALRFLTRRSMRALARALAPLGKVANYRNTNEVLVEIPYFDRRLTEGMRDLRAVDP